MVKETWTDIMTWRIKANLLKYNSTVKYIEEFWNIQDLTIKGIKKCVNILGVDLARELFSASRIIIKQFEQFGYIREPSENNFVAFIYQKTNKKKKQIYITAIKRDSCFLFDLYFNCIVGEILTSFDFGFIFIDLILLRFQKLTE